ncbi:hypothetical protein CKA81_15985 [Pollutimonas thiosulfatoxidans]|uniref:Glutamate--cysteine ligase n=2 Tax=Pollutimonas thiosulfatoxidans TaxID=2028345 RepID=A0A410GFV6_9BURK|nr:glutamate-cysteine ligase family protein [Pollutimonas thiosulfatoxidans]QAA95196.1 hypothetical protein CKA81_15985 [Pollutimonas thiosulfatoxidans]
MNPTIPPIGSSSETPDATAYQSLLGLEIEMVPVHAGTGTSQPVSRYFDALRSIKLAKGVRATPFMLQGHCVALHTATGECGLDNGFNLLETALAPVNGGPGGLARLAQLAHEELADTMAALLADDACVLNASQHPACRRDADWYSKVCVPRPIYDELRGYRGWHHWEGIDAKAQNGANTSVPVHDAVAALNISLALAPAAIALFGNSPLESGRVTGLKETRMTLWPRVFGPARFAGDAWLSQYPGRPFHGLGDFFTWMFGEGTVSRALPISDAGDYKSAATAVLADDPCLSSFLKAPGWTARCLDTGKVTHLLPDTAHFEYSQIGQFLDARLRYALRTRPPLAELLAAWQQEHGLEQLFEQCGAQVYIEARAPGAGFADAVLLQEAGAEVAHSMLLAPIALQCGLLANLDEAGRLVASWGWQPLGRLRQPAMRLGLEDDRVAALCTEVLAVARDGLAKADRPWLAYADHVLQTRRSAADRMLASWHTAGGSLEDRLALIARRHAALHPDQYGGLGAAQQV